jgi:hypothetical protein
VVSLTLALVACGGSDSETEPADPEMEASAEPVEAEPEAEDSGAGDANLGTATITVEPEGRTFDVTGECELARMGFEEGAVDDAASPGVSVSIAFDNATTEPEAQFPFNMTAVTSVTDDGTFPVRSRGGLDNTSVMFTGVGSAEVIEADGVYGIVRFVLTLTQDGPITDRTGPPVFDDQPAERTITGDIPCTIGIR